MNPWDHVEAGGEHSAAAETGPVRYERGSRVYASDGPIGTLRQIVVDEERGEVTILVVQPADGAEPVMAPVGLVVGSAGQAIFLRVTQEQFALGAARSPRYERRQFAAANLKRLARLATGPLHADRLRAISRVDRDAVVTGPVGDGRGPAAAPVERRFARMQRRAAPAAQAPAAIASSSAD